MTELHEPGQSSLEITLKNLEITVQDLLQRITALEANASKTATPVVQVSSPPEPGFSDILAGFGG